MRNLADVLIIGGGIIGLTTAYSLAKAGARVTVLDRQDLGREASWAGAGIIAPGRLAGAATPIDQLRALSAESFPALSAELRERTGVDNGYRQTGGLEFEEYSESIDPVPWTQEGIAWERVDASVIEPSLPASTDPAYWLPGMAQVRNPRHLAALKAAVTSLGVVLRPGCPVIDLEQASSRITAALTPDGPAIAGQYLVCAGAWSDGLLGRLGVRLGVTPVRGQMVLLNSRALEPSRILIRGKRYLVPRGDGRVLVGSTEEDAGFDKRTTAGGIAGLLRFATELVPSLAAAAVEQCWAGLRPGSADGLPSIGPVSPFDNLWVAAGHFRSGIQLSPATAQVLSAAMLGRPTALSLQPFRPDRPAAPPVRVAFRS